MKVLNADVPQHHQMFSPFIHNALSAEGGPLQGDLSRACVPFFFGGPARVFDLQQLPAW